MTRSPLPPLRPAPAHEAVPHAEDMIQLHGVIKQFSNAAGVFTILKGVDLTIHRGEFVSIVGKSGSGKSTLMHAMSGLDRPEKGEVIIDGQDILKLSQKEIDKFRSKKMSFIFQSFLLYFYSRRLIVILFNSFCMFFDIYTKQLNCMAFKLNRHTHLSTRVRSWHIFSATPYAA